MEPLSTFPLAYAGNRPDSGAAAIGHVTRVMAGITAIDAILKICTLLNRIPNLIRSVIPMGHLGYEEAIFVLQLCAITLAIVACVQSLRGRRVAPWIIIASVLLILWEIG